MFYIAAETYYIYSKSATIIVFLLLFYLKFKKLKGVEALMFANKTDKN